MPPVAIPKQTGMTLGGLLLLAILWHLSLPGWFYHTPATYLEGPLPALAGAALGLWLHQAEPARTKLLGACAGAILGSLLAVLIGGTALLGPLSALLGFYALLRDTFHVPFLALISAFGSPYLPYVFWMGVKTLLIWGAVAYVLDATRRADLRERFRSLWAARSEQGAFNAEQRRQWQDYRKQYLAAVKAGGPVPAAPAGLVAPGAIPGGGSWHSRAILVYWLVRIGIAIAGFYGFYAAFKQQMFGMGEELLFPALMRGLFGGG